MKKLEDKILKKIYKIETKKTVGQIISEMTLIIFVTFSSIFIFSIIVEILNEQTSFDLFDFFRDDFETIRDNLINNSVLFIRELPLPLLYILIGLLLSLVWLLFILVNNFNKIKTKLVSIYKFWSTTGRKQL